VRDIGAGYFYCKNDIVRKYHYWTIDFGSQISFFLFLFLFLFFFKEGKMKVVGMGILKVAKNVMMRI